MNLTLAKGNGFIPLGTTVLFIKRKEKERSETEKKNPKWSSQRDVQLQRGVAIGFYTKDSFFARVERWNERYLLPGVLEWEESTLRYGECANG